MTFVSHKFGDVCNFVRGPFGGSLKKDSFVSEGYAVYEQQHAIYNQFHDIRYFIDANKFNEMNRFELNAGDIIMSCSGTMGKIAIVPTNVKKGVINQALLKITPSPSVDVKYLKFWMDSDSFQRQVSSTNGSAIQNVSSVKILKEVEIPLPPLETQKKIAAVLEKADQLRKDCQQMEQELNSLAQSVFIDMFGDPVTNPKGWDTATLDTLAKVQIGPFGSQLHKEDYISDGIPLINPTHIIKGNVVPDTSLTLTAEKFKTLPNYHLKIGDIIMGRRGEMGRTALIKEQSQGWFCGTGSLYIRPTSPLIESVYLNSVMSCSSMKVWLEEQSLGATMPNLNKKILHSIQVPLPTEALQRNYILALDIVNQQKHEQKKHINELNNLFNSLMQKAFNGELNL